MATTEVPTTFRHKCDVCGTETTTASSSRPDHWTGLTLARDAYDFQGAACADASIKRLLCPTCTEVVVNAINTASASLTHTAANRERQS